MIVKLNKKKATHVYCDSCDDIMPIAKDGFDLVTSDDLDEFVGGELVCKRCSLVIATVFRKVEQQLNA